jgi:hypothetical protein
MLICCVALLAFIPADEGQYPKRYFRSPVDIPLSLSGAFAEIRQNHFHSGIDIRTEGVEGKPVYAIADGFVSRVFVSPTGFGKALYVNHPNGYTSVYGHLRSFAGPTAGWVRSQQYKAESFALDRELPPGTIRVKKGEVIAYSGNSGASGGPHLHFEIRETATQETIDPLEFGFLPPDDAAPQISWVKIYPLDQNSMVNYAGKPLLLPVTGSGGKFFLKSTDTVSVSGNIIFGIETSEQPGGRGFRTGVTRITLFVDNKPCFEQHIERFAFAQTRYVNSLMDYPAFMQNRRKIQRSYIAPNNKLTVYGPVVNRGIQHFSDNRVHRVRYEVKDVFGNRSTLEFSVQSHLPPGAGGRPGSPEPQGDQRFSCREDNQFSRSDLRLTVPGDALYEDLSFLYDMSPALTGTFSNVHHLHNPNTPLHTYCTLSIKPLNLPVDLRDKALIVEVEPNNRRSSRGGKFENGFVTAQIRSFGNYAVAVDTVPPVIRPVNVFPNKKVAKQFTIMVKISDNLSGIRSYRGTLNGEWILMDYDAKKNLLVYSFDERMKKGKNLFRLVVTDATGNTTRYEAALLR